MNRYLAICHALSLLESPLTPAAYAHAVQPANPLFAGGCITPQSFLLWLQEEGLLEQSSETFRLNARGQLLNQHLLGWTARDREAITQHKAELRASGADEPVAPDCPACGSGFCAHYLFAILLERLYAGLPEARAWLPDEPALLSQALLAIAGHQPARLLLLSETQPLNTLLPQQQQQLEAGLRQATAAGLQADTLADFRRQAESALLLPELPDLPLLHVRIPRLRFAHSLMPAEQLQALRRLAYPQLFPSSAAQRSEDHFIVCARPGCDASRRQALLYLSDNGHARLLILHQTPAGWRLDTLLAAEDSAPDFRVLSGRSEA